jgi:hypothetical protein
VLLISVACGAETATKEADKLASPVTPVATVVPQETTTTTTTTTYPHVEAAKSVAPAVDMDLTTLAGKYSQIFPEYVTECDNGEVVTQGAMSINRDVMIVDNEISIGNSVSAVDNENGESIPGFEITSIIPYGGLIEKSGSFSTNQKVVAEKDGKELVMLYSMKGVISEGKWEGKILLFYTFSGVTCRQETPFSGEKQ